MSWPGKQFLALRLVCLWVCVTCCSQEKRCIREMFGDPPFFRLGVSPEPVDGVQPCAWDADPVGEVQLRIRSVVTTCIQGSYGRLQCGTRALGLAEGTVVCAAGIGVRLPEYAARLTVDQVVRMQVRTNTLNPELDVIHTATIRDQQGFLLLGWTWGNRPAEFEKDLFQGLELSTDAPFCSSTDGASPAMLHLKTGVEDCAVRDATDSTCTLWGQPFSVRVFDAYLQSSGPSPYITFTIARPDFLSPGVLP